MDFLLIEVFLVYLIAIKSLYFLVVEIHAIVLMQAKRMKIVFFSV
jgi:hypothetical protein